MSEEMEFCTNCKRDISKANFIIHSAHCHRNIKVCTVCNEPVPIKEMDEHVAEMHKIVPCEKCGKTIEKWKLENHELSCVKRQLACQYCEVNCSWDEIKDHESYCGARTEQCSKCQRYVMIKNKAQHYKEECTSSKTNSPCFKGSDSCQYCAVNFPIDEIKEHEYYCCAVSEKCPKCQQCVLIHNRAQHKEKCAAFKTKGKDGVYCFICKSFISGDFAVHKILCFSQKDDSFKELKSKNMAKKSFDDDISQVASRFSKLSTSEDMHFSRNLHSTAANTTDKTSDSYLKSLSPSKNGTLFLKQSQNGKTTYEECSKKQEKRLHGVAKSGYNSNDCEPHSNNTLRCATCLENVKIFEYNSHSERCGRTLVECHICNEKMLAADLRKHKECCSKKFLFGQKGNMEDGDSLILKSGMIRCPACKEQFTTFEMKDHKLVCHPKMENCIVCHEEVLMSQRTAHQEICLLKKNMSCITQRGKEDRIIPIGTTLEAMDTMSDIPVESNSTSYHNSPKKFEESKDERWAAVHSEPPVVTKGEHNFQIPSKGAHSLDIEQKPVSVRRKTKPFNSSVQAAKANIICPCCKDLFSSLDIEGHIANCIIMREECLVCRRKVPTERLKKHQEECFKSLKSSVGQEHNQVFKNTKLVEECFVDCRACNKKFRLSEIDEHMLECILNSKVCQICKKQIIDSQFEAHQINCVEKKFNQQEGNKIMTYHNSKKHFESCPRCDVLIFREELNDHMAQCPEFRVCFMCAINVPSLMYENHITECKQNSPKFQDVATSGTSVMNKQKRKYKVKSLVECSKISQDFPPLKSQNKTDQNVVEVSLPCEFCEELYPESQIIQHQSGCQPLLLHYPLEDEEEYFSASESFDYGKKMKSGWKKGEHDKNTQLCEFFSQQNSQSWTSSTSHTEKQQHGYPFGDIVNSFKTRSQGNKADIPNSLLQAIESRRECMKSPENEDKSPKNESFTLGSEVTFDFRKFAYLNTDHSFPTKASISKNIDEFDNQVQISNGNNDLTAYLKESNAEKIPEKFAIDHVCTPGVHSKSSKKLKRKKSKGKRKGKN